MAGKVTFTELCTVVTLNDVIKINALLDMERDIQIYHQKKQEAQSKFKR